ncbi:GNAT family N-acetyltransferase, partial [Deinococcus pimensis]|uniref:GNAT family N-acetyltransferase n=1 Tax=Deinococcus pimensis TaxID=309888 RepID=UPI0005EB8E9B
IVEELARSRGARWLRLETYAPNTASSRFYERLGYLRRGHLRLTPGGDRVIPLDCYEKRLAP